MRKCLVIFSVFVGSMLFTVNSYADTGVVKWYNRAKGYGFIIPDNGAADLYFYYSRFLDEEESNHLEEGVCLQYNLRKDPRTQKLEADQIEIIGCWE